MKSSEELRRMLRSIDHKGYPAYKSLAGMYQFDSFVLSIDHVQGDPFASPSSLHVEMQHAKAGIPEEYYDKKCSRTALQDFLTRQAGKQFEACNFKAKGSGKSGLMSISRCGQEVLERSACEITDKGIVLRFHIGFPAFGRTIQAGELEKILFDFLPHCVENSLCFKKLNQKKLSDAVHLAEDQEAVREILRKEGLVAFVADGSVLPRRSGVSELPMENSVAFKSPESLARVLHLPHRGDICGMAVPKGITLIVGGGYHGKSTLLEALQNGVYNHIAGDGREFVITDDTAVKLRAEDGRSIRNVDISMFINDLPNKKDTKKFSTPDASGSTSQAAGVVESMEAGSRLLLIDEDTSATNFMVRDALMQQVICREKEPITPFIERIRDLYEKAGVSTILVAGSSGAFFYKADRIIQMDCYRTVDITEKVRGICVKHPVSEAGTPDFVMSSFNRPCPGLPNNNAGADHAGRGMCRNERGRGRKERGGRDRHEHLKVKTFGRDSFSVDRETVDIRYIEQLADGEQTSSLAYMMRYVIEHGKGNDTVEQMGELLFELLEKKGWEPFCGSFIPCGLAKPRKQEIYAVLNRYRG